MSQVIVFTNTDGGVSVIHPTAEALATMTVAEIAAKDVPAGTPYKIVDKEILPTDRTFRNAWEADVNHNVNINMTKALGLKQEMVRAERAPLLESLDVAFMQALESGDTTAQASITNQKQALRDATVDPVLLNATTPEELKAAVPAALAS